MNQREEYVLGRDVTEQAQARENRGTVVISFRISSEEFDALTKHAGVQGNTVSQIAHEAFRRGLTPREPTLWAAMSFAGGNMVSFGNVEAGTIGTEEADIVSGEQELDGFRVLTQKTA